ncbi:MarR family winged helix-turn-helix transcriptional regulator [Litorihabitans aurantiacus]|uniref:HTH marR-type domain-containing protein n=1 Tax=Litorihabitans aurantiacus TaxID=1930061 RepID=A0AA37XG31_9MICO|nr:MarR family transcriptional regulator [Litorihabitans aurantiacus]GMA32878.1 hypothetical protein GCM10025875_28700 [Litorihabitans aurantiacus]
MSRTSSEAARRPSATAAAPYWYGRGERPDAVAVLTLLRRYREAETAALARLGDVLGLSDGDTAAVRHLLLAARDGHDVRQRELALALGMTDASVSGLVDRLERRGYVRREPHPEDRRSLRLVVTDVVVRAAGPGGDAVMRGSTAWCARCRPTTGWSSPRCSSG